MKKKLILLFKFLFKLIHTNKFISYCATQAFHKYFKDKGSFFYYEKDKLSFLLHRNETISNSIFLNDEFEFSKFSQSLNYIKKKKRTLIDIGANIGSITIPALKKNLFKDALIFEPNPESLRLLKVNLLINNLEKKVNLKEIALSNIKSLKTLKSDLAYNSGDNRLVSKKKRC